MILRDLINLYSWSKIKVKMHKLDLEINSQYLKQVYDKICLITAKKSEMLINIDKYGVFGKKTNSEETYSLVFTPWEEWLGMLIDPKTLQKKIN